MNISSFISKRLLFSILVIIGLSIVIFIIARIIPGDPARMALGPRASEEIVQRLREEMHLDKSVPEQYFYWFKGILSGDFGTSLVFKKKVSEDIKRFLPATLEMVFFAGLQMVFFAIGFGVFAAKYKDTWIDSLIRNLTYLGVAIPAFVISILAILLFGYKWQVLPTLGRLSSGLNYPNKVTGFLTIDSLIERDFAVFWDAFKHLILPSFALAFGRLCQEAQITRATMIDNMDKDYIFTMRSYGIPERIIMFKYLLKPSVIPTLTVIGLDFAFAFTNAFLVETIFVWPGLSRYGIEAILHKDLNAISAVVMVNGAIFVTMNIIVDVIVAMIDPRIRLGYK